MAARKIFRFLQVCRAVRIAYENQFRQVMLVATRKIQRSYRGRFLRRQAQLKGVYRAIVYLDPQDAKLGDITSVDVFGEFSEQTSAGSWGLKVPCLKGLDGVYSAQIDIKLGHNFKFIIDGGRSYAVSKVYHQTADGAGNLNNVYRFHQRSVTKNIEAPLGGQRYPKNVYEQSWSTPQKSVRSLPPSLDDIPYNSDAFELPAGFSSRALGHPDIDSFSAYTARDTPAEMHQLLGDRFDAQKPFNLTSEDDRGFQEYSTIASCSVTSPTSDSNRDDHLILKSEELPLKGRDVKMTLVPPSMPVKKNLSAQFDQSLLLSPESLLSGSRETEHADQSNQKPEYLLTEFNETEEEIKYQAEKATSLCMLKQTSVPLLPQVDSLGSFYDSADKLSLSSRSGGLTSCRFSFNPSNLNAMVASMPDFSKTINQLGVGHEFDSEGLHGHVHTDGRTRLSIISAAHTIGKTATTNEDAFFVDERAFGIADGVSGWEATGDVIKPDINRDEARSSNKSHISDQRSKLFHIDPTYILSKASAGVKAVGSSTAVVGILNGNSITVSNLGDSGFLHYRQRECQTRYIAGSILVQALGNTSLRTHSKAQTHSFNIPFQMSNLPNEAQMESLIREGKTTEANKLKSLLNREKQAICNDQPADADKYTFQLQLGDVIVTATDGVFDNLFNREILELVDSYKRERYALKQESGAEVSPCLLADETEAQELARRICCAAREKYDAGQAGKRVETPYQRKFKKTYNSVWDGGKLDDITTVVTLVVLQGHQH